MIKTVVAHCFFLCSIGLCNGQGVYQHTTTYISEPEGDPREHELDIQRMSLDVKFDPQIGLVKGKVTHVFKVLRRNVDSIRLDAVNIRVQQVTIASKPARYRSDDSSLVIYCEPQLHWDTVDSLAITYSVTPRKGIYFVGWQDTTAGRQQQIWTQGQRIDNRYWIPMYDEQNDKMITETTITFDSAFKVVSNGERRSVVSNSDGTKTWRYAMTHQHASYLLMIAIGRYDTTQKRSASGVPIELYSYLNKTDQIEPTYRNMEQIFNFLEEFIGVPYQWGVYRQVPVADFIFGAMENTTATVFGDFYLTDARERLDRTYLGVNIHELAHQWFGDLITARSFKHQWLHESFATYYPLMYSLKYEGEDAYQWSLRGMQNAAIAAGEQNQLPVVSTKSGGPRIYQKGACIIDMMRLTFGDQELQRVLKLFLQRHAFDVVETNDLLVAFQDTLGISPVWFFDQWLYRGGEPHFEVSYTDANVATTEGSHTNTIVSVDQKQSTNELTGYFKVITSIEVHYTDGSMDSSLVTIDGPHSTVIIPNKQGRKVDFVLFDPGSRILKKLTFRRTQQELLSQIQKAPFMIDRYDAFVALVSDSANNKVAFDVASSIIEKEKFYAIRAEAQRFMVKQGYSGNLRAWDFVGKGLQDSHVEVRKATLYALITVPSSVKEQVEDLLTDSSYHLIQNALTRLCRSFPDQAKAYAERVEDVRSPGGYVEVTAAEILVDLGDKKALANLGSFCGAGYEFSTRQNALKAFKRIHLTSELGAKNIVDAAISPNGRLSASAFETLDYLWEQNTWRPLLRSAVKSAQIPRDLRERMEKYSN